jgi:hypothetical protein
MFAATSSGLHAPETERVGAFERRSSPNDAIAYFEILNSRLFYDRPVATHGRFGSF